MSHAEPVSRRLWSDWLFERVPLPPVLLGALLATALLGLLALLAAVNLLDREALLLFARQLYVGIPLLSWIGAALVLHVLEEAIG